MAAWGDSSQPTLLQPPGVAVDAGQKQRLRRRAATPNRSLIPFARAWAEPIGSIVRPPGAAALDAAQASRHVADTKRSPTVSVRRLPFAGSLRCSPKVVSCPPPNTEPRDEHHPIRLLRASLPVALQRRPRLCLSVRRAGARGHRRAGRARADQLLLCAHGDRTRVLDAGFAGGRSAL